MGTHLPEDLTARVQHLERRLRVTQALLFPLVAVIMLSAFGGGQEVAEVVKAIAKGVGLIAIKPLAAGSIVKLDPRAKAESVPENERVTLYNTREKVLLPQVVRQLSQSLDQHPEETLAQAALRFVFSRPFMTAAMPGMFQEHEVDENHAALTRHLQFAQGADKLLDAARHVAVASNRKWLPAQYRWLDDWRRV